MARPSFIKDKINLATFTSWTVGGEADHFVQPATVDELRAAYLWALADGLQVTVLGGGTNVLVSDDGVRGLVISLRKLVGATSSVSDGRLMIDALSGTTKSELLKIFLKAQLSPALFLAGLPGDIGGGIVMNAGVAEAMTPREFMDMVDAVEVMRADGSLITLPRSALQVAYRHCDGWQPGILTRAMISWPATPMPDVLAQVREANKIRLSKQPLDMPSCGSVFRNPPGTSAGRVIDSLALKGFTVGGARVSEKHANFIVNAGGATARDIHAVISHVRAEVQARAGLTLKTEVVYIGEWIGAR